MLPTASLDESSYALTPTADGVNDTGSNLVTSLMETKVEYGSVKGTDEGRAYGTVSEGEGEEPLVRIRLDEARSRTRDERALISGQSSGTG